MGRDYLEFNTAIVSDNTDFQYCQYCLSNGYWNNQYTYVLWLYLCVNLHCK